MVRNNPKFFYRIAQSVLCILVRFKGLGRLLRRRFKSLKRTLFGSRSHHVQVLHGQALKSQLVARKNAARYDFHKLNRRVMGFLDSLRSPTSPFQYRYAPSNQQASLYASVYACMTMSILGQLSHPGGTLRRGWAEYFNSFQDHETGYFVDPIVRTPLYWSADWWGARHLAVHITTALTQLGARPRHRLRFLDEYKDLNQLQDWLNSINWHTPIPFNDDVDNRIMNVGCLLQYERDFCDNNQAGRALSFMEEFLLSKLRQDVGIWCNYNPEDETQRSRMVQFAYHLLTVLKYDNIRVPSESRIVEYALETQNSFGGFGVSPNSSACEDIDSIDILIRLMKPNDPRRNRVIESLHRALQWVMANQETDGGFSFRVGLPMEFGHAAMQEKVSEGAMLPTWFRVLSLAYITRFLGLPNEFTITRSPGYEF